MTQTLFASGTSLNSNSASEIDTTVSSHKNHRSWIAGVCSYCRKFFQSTAYFKATVLQFLNWKWVESTWHFTMHHFWQFALLNKIPLFPEFLLKVNDLIPKLCSCTQQHDVGRGVKVLLSTVSLQKARELWPWQHKYTDVQYLAVNALGFALSYKVATGVTQCFCCVSLQQSSSKGNIR